MIKCRNRIDMIAEHMRLEKALKETPLENTKARANIVGKLIKLDIEMEYYNNRPS